MSEKSRKASGRRGAIALLAAAFAAAEIAWCLWLPLDPDLMYRAVPADATVVTEHDRLGARWPELAGGPLAASLAAAGGVEPEDLARAWNDPAIVTLMRQFAPRKTVFAYSPRYGAAGCPAWIAVSWIGSRAQFMRWGLAVSTTGSSSLRRIRLRDGRSAWLLETGVAPASAGNVPAVRPPVLTMAVVGGAVVTVLSEDPNALWVTVARMESGAAADPWWREGASGAPDCGGALLPASPSGPVRFRFAVESPAGGRVSARLRGPRLAGMTPCRIGDWRGLGDVVGDEACVVAALPFAQALAILADVGWSPSDGGVTNGIVSAADTNGVAFACVLGEKHRGRLLVPVPTLVAGLPLREAGVADRAVAETLDQINARHAWSLIRRPADAGGASLLSVIGLGGDAPLVLPAKTRVAVVDSGKGGLYGNLGNRDKVAYAEAGSWLLVASNAGGLAGALKAAESAAGPRARPRWQRGLEGTPSAGYLWADVREAESALRSALAAYSVFRLASRAEGPDTVVGVLARARIWCAALTSYEEVTARLSVEGGEFLLTIGFHAGDGSRE